MSKKPLTDREVHHRLRASMKRKLIASLTFIVVPLIALITPQVAVEAAIGRAPVFWAVVVRLAGAATIPPLLAWVFFASDPAVRGENRVAKWFRSKLAKHLAVAKFSCSESEASEIWFKYFDTWGIVSSPHFSLMEQTYAATYAMRLIFYLERALLLCLYGGIALVAVRGSQSAFYWTPDGRLLLTAQLVLLLIYALAYFYVRLSNRLGDRSGRPTGAFDRVNDILGRSALQFREEVLSQSDSVSSALAVVARIRRDLETKAKRDRG